MEKGIVDGEGTIPAHHQSAIVADPGEGALYNPATPVAAQRTTILRRWFAAVPTVRRDQLDVAVCQPGSQWIAVVALVGDHPLRLLPRPAPRRNPDRRERRLGELDFRRGCNVKVVSQRKTRAVDHHHPLRPLAPLGFADSIAPFFAGAKLPSKNDSLHFSCWRSFSSPRNARQICSQTPCSSQSRNRRQQVDGCGYSSGKFFQGAPLRRIHSIPSSTRRLSAHGRPPRGFCRSWGSSGSIFFHWGSVNNGPDRGMYSPFNHVIRYPKLPSQGKSMPCIRLCNSL